MSKIMYQAFALFSVLTLALTGYTTLRAQEPNNASHVSMPTPPDVEGLRKQVEINEQQRQQIIHDLANTVGNLDMRQAAIIGVHDAKGKEAIAAIVLLGKLHAKNYIDLLECYIEVQDRSSLISASPTIYSEYPAVGALAEIGYPAVESVTMFFAEDYSAKKLPLVSAIIYSVLGKEVGLAFLDQEIASEIGGDTDHREHKNLIKLRTYFQQRDGAHFALGF